MLLPGQLDSVVSRDPIRFFTADEVLGPYIYTFYIAFIVAFIFTPVMRRIAIYYGIIDQPDRIRKMHSAPVAYLGGVAVFLGWLGGLALSQFVHMHVFKPDVPDHVPIKFSIVGGAILIVVLGLWDDVKKISPRVKIMGQVLAALLLLLDGVGTKALEQIFVPINIRLMAWQHIAVPEWVIVVLSSIVVIGVVVGCCNAANLMDGLDGLCGGVTAIIAIGFLFVAVNLAMTGGAKKPELDALRVVLALVLLGSVLGFTPFNFNPASIFMGDTGSMFLGFSCATLIILMSDGEHPKWFLASMVIFALPVLDTVLAFARRYVNGRSLFSADRFHFHHQLVARGLSVKQTVLVSYGLTFFFAIAGISIVFMRTRYAIAFYLVIFGSLIVAAYKMGMVHEKPRVITRMPLAGNTAVNSGTLEAGSVVEIRENDPAAAGSAASPSVEGGWREPSHGL